MSFLNKKYSKLQITVLVKESLIEGGTYRLAYHVKNGGNLFVEKPWDKENQRNRPRYLIRKNNHL